MAQILLVASSPKAETLFSSMILETHSVEIVCLHAAKEAWRTLQEQNYSLVLVLSPLSDGTGYDLAKMAASNTASGVILVCRPESYEEASKRLHDMGIFVFSTAMGRKMFDIAVDMMLAVNQRILNAVPQTERLQQKMKDIRVVDKAKCLLIQYEHMTEEEAHYKIEKRAMNQRVSKRAVAEEILKFYGG